MKKNSMKFLSTLLLFPLGAQASGVLPYSIEHGSSAIAGPESGLNHGDLSHEEARHVEDQLMDRILTQIVQLLDQAGRIEGAIFRSAYFLRSLVKIYSQNSVAEDSRVESLAVLEEGVRAFAKKNFLNGDPSDLRVEFGVIERGIKEIETFGMSKEIVEVIADYLIGDSREFFKSGDGRNLNLEYIKTRLGIHPESRNVPSQESVTPDSSGSLVVYSNRQSKNQESLPVNAKKGVVTEPVSDLIVHSQNHLPDQESTESDPRLSLDDINKLKFKYWVNAAIESGNLLTLYDCYDRVNKEYWKSVGKGAGIALAGATGGIVCAALPPAAPFVVGAVCSFGVGGLGVAKYCASIKELRTLRKRVKAEIRRLKGEIQAADRQRRKR